MCGNKTNGLALTQPITKPFHRLRGVEYQIKRKKIVPVGQVMKILPVTFRPLVAMALIVGMLGVFGCDYSTPNPGYLENEERYFDPYEVLDELQHYQESGFVLMNEEPFESKAIEGAWITIWVSKDAADAYREINIDDRGSGAQLPVGSIIVREVSDQTGNVDKLTVIARAEDGANPSAGNLWFATVTPGGELEDETHSGFLPSCIGCHASRPDDGFLFGVPKQIHDIEH